MEDIDDQNVYGKFSFSDLTPDEYRRLRRRGRLPAFDDEAAFRRYKDEWSNPKSWIIPGVGAVLGGASGGARGGFLSTIGGATVGLGVGLVIQKAIRLAENRKARKLIQNQATKLSDMYS